MRTQQTSVGEALRQGAEPGSHYHILKKLDAFHGNGLLERNGRYPFVQIISLLTWINYPQFVQPKVIERYAHRWRKGRGIATLDLNANTSRSTEHQKIDFGTLVGGPEIGLIRLGRVEQLFDHEPFPRCTQFRVRQQIAPRS